MSESLDDERFLWCFYRSMKPFDHLSLNLVLKHCDWEFLGLNRWRSKGHEIYVNGPCFRDVLTLVEGEGAIALVQYILGCDKLHAIQELYLLDFQLGRNVGA